MFLVNKVLCASIALALAVAGCGGGVGGSGSDAPEAQVQFPLSGERSGVFTVEDSSLPMSTFAESLAAVNDSNKNDLVLVAVPDPKKILGQGLICIDLSSF